MKKPKRRKQRGPKRWWSWPLPDIPLEDWTMSQMRTAVLHPMVTGLGRHPRSITDEAWVAAAIRETDVLGDFAFWYGFVELLRASMPAIIVMGDEDYPPLKDYPPLPPNAIKLPLPSAQVMGDRQWAANQGWTGEMVSGLCSNPVLAGIPPFGAIVPLQQWASTAAVLYRRAEEGGPVQYLVNVLYCLRSTYGCSGQPYGRVPFGYKFNEEIEE